MVGYKAAALFAVLAASSHAFAPASVGQSSTQLSATDTITFDKVDKRTNKPTGTSFLPAEAVERASKGNPIEKAKLAKDGTSAFVDDDMGGS